MNEKEPNPKTNLSNELPNKFSLPVQSSSFSQSFLISREDFKKLIAVEIGPETKNRFTMLMVGISLTAISLGGALIGYVRAYNRFFKDKDLAPVLYLNNPIIRVAMITGGVIAWLVVLLFIVCLSFLASNSGFTPKLITIYIIVNSVTSIFVLSVFMFWQSRISSTMIESKKFGSARFAREHELTTLQNQSGFYIGQGHKFHYKGHILTVAGTRGGKGTNLIIPNLLGAGGLETSWIVIDPKGENAAITARYQREIGQNVIILNPWDLLAANVGTAQSYNPLDMLAIESLHLVDDIQVIAEMIVPVSHDEKNSFWTDSARTIVSGLLLHIVTSQPKELHTLTTLWEWVRYQADDWDKIIQDMAVNDHALHKGTIKNAGLEILKLQSAGEDTFGGIISSVLQATDFLKSPALQQSLKTGFDPKILVDGKTTVYVIIPADKLKSHYRWLRLVVTSMMRAVIRKPDKRVTFLLDEFAALGYLPEIETALSTYAGYNVTVWPILQSLIQLHNLYKNNWETFIANCTVRQYFTINDNFSAEYISKAIGETSNLIVSKDADPKANARRLVTPDELRRESGKKIFMFISDLPPTYVDKLPYYLLVDLKGKADRNPYI
ncbi:type IV secretory system conjugative DNA transfer family protein [Mucilaginibacter ginsenosidivorax]|nr:type IV secretory system conjugative DNA transfer family protein [Mucilaginibacter ginsenosidivorax]